MKLKRREKIWLVCCEIVIVLGAFFMFYDTPHRRKMTSLKEELKATDLKLAELPLLTKGAETVQAEVARLEEELDRVSQKTLKGEEFRAFLKHLAKESDPLQMKIISLVPQEEEPTLSEEKKGLSPIQYKKVIIQMVVHSNYNKLGSYLNRMSNLPFLINVDHLQIERNGEIQPFLKITMGLYMYMTEP